MTMTLKNTEILSRRWINRVALCQPFSSSFLRNDKSSNRKISEISFLDVYNGNDVEEKECLQEKLASDIRPYFLAKQPVAIRSCNRHTVAYEKWHDINYLRNKVGEDTMCEVEIGGAYTSSEIQKSTVEFGYYCDYVHLTKDNALTHSNEIVYLAQNQVFEPLYDDFTIPQFCEDSSMNVGEGSLDLQMFWFGPTGCISPLHFDPLDNIFMQFHGTKEILLYKPFLDNSNADFYPGGAGQYNTSKVDVENPDLLSYPNFSRLPKPFSCRLEKGDLLYIPKGWWHYVRTKEQSVSISIFWR